VVGCYLSEHISRKTLGAYVHDVSKRLYNDIPNVTLDGKRPSFSTVMNSVAGFRTGHSSTEDEERSGDQLK
jgi:hypothetical protein